jgi:hypothetical protein
MVYYGVTSGPRDPNVVFGWLREALRAAGPGSLRGPAAHQGAGWVYSGQTSGDIGRFSGSEQIEVAGTMVYRADFIGGWVDRVDAV